MPSLYLFLSSRRQWLRLLLEPLPTWPLPIRLTQCFGFVLQGRGLPAARRSLGWQLQEQLRVRLHFAHGDLPRQISELRLYHLLVLLLGDRVRPLWLRESLRMSALHHLPLLNALGL